MQEDWVGGGHLRELVQQPIRQLVGVDDHVGFAQSGQAHGDGSPAHGMRAGRDQNGLAVSIQRGRQHVNHVVTLNEAIQGQLNLLIC